MNDKLDRLIAEVSTLSTSLQDLRIEFSNLSRKVRNPEHEKYTVMEAAGRMKVSRQTLYRRVNEGHLELYREGGRTYTTEAEILRCERRMRS